MSQAKITGWALTVLLAAIFSAYISGLWPVH